MKPKNLSVNLKNVAEIRDCFFGCFVFLNSRFSVAELHLGMAEAMIMFNCGLDDKIEEQCKESVKKNSAKC